MSDRIRARVNAAFDEELEAAPVPAGLRPVTIRAAVAAPRPHSNRPALLALVAGFVVIAIAATLVIGANLLGSKPVPSGSTTPPPARAGAAVAYDAARGVMVLFGGAGDSGTGMLGDTWTFDGKVWRHLHPAVSPQPRSTFAMAYDQARHDVVLFGGMAQVGPGKGGLQAVDDTWIWDGSTWKEMHPANEPAFGYDWDAATMQFDPITQTVLMYGYTRSTSETGASIRAETWSWDGSRWTEISTSGPTTIGTMLFDGARVLLIAASAGLVGGRYVTQTWAWDGSRWTLLHPKVDLPILGNPTGAYDADTHQLVLLTGDTWLWDGSTWSRAHPTTQPPMPGYTAYIAPLHEVITWNDITSGLDFGLYGWTGTDWKVLVPGKDNPLNDGGKGYLGVMTSDQAATEIRAVVTAVRPVLVPTQIAAGWDATVSAQSDGFTVRYQSDLRDKSIEFGIEVANPPPGGPSAKDYAVKFRHALALKFRPSGYAEYFVFDTAVSNSSRWLMWIEPGAMTHPEIAGPGVPYFLSSTGLTDAEFWQVANSLR